jgi:hypothetical protein
MDTGHQSGSRLNQQSVNPPDGSDESRRIRRLYWHPGWPDEAASVFGTVDGGRGRVGFAGGDPSEHGWETRDRWLQESCEHGGYRVSAALGNSMRVQHLREFLRGLQGEPGPKFPIRVMKVAGDGTHAGDGPPVKESPAFQGSGFRARVERHFDRGRESVSPQQEAVVRSPDRDGQSDYVLTCGSCRGSGGGIWIYGWSF